MFVLFFSQSWDNRYGSNKLINHYYCYYYYYIRIFPRSDMSSFPIVFDRHAVHIVKE